jgi:hypothetical protein
MIKIFTILSMLSFLFVLYYGAFVKVCDTNTLLFWGIMCLFYLLMVAICKVEIVIELMHKDKI